MIGGPRRTAQCIAHGIEMKTLLSAVVLAALASPGLGQDLQLPTNPRAWINSPAVSLETLRGKGVVFYFFEET